jgi:hypothetical protein
LGWKLRKRAFQQKISIRFCSEEQICFFCASLASWENDFLLQSPYLQDRVSGERTMQANEAFTGTGVVNAGPGGLSARLCLDLSPRNLAKAA